MSTDWKWPGARWWRCDLHVHTPTSYDFKHREAVTHAQWVAGANQAEVDVLAVTDHNAAAGVDEARKGAQFMVFPGVELTVSPGVHLLAIFDPAANRDVVSALLGRVKIPADKFGDRDATSPLSVEQAITAIHDAGGVCIAAHVDRDSGILQAYPPGQHRQACLTHPELAAAEVKRWSWTVDDPAIGGGKIQKTWDGEYAKYFDGSLQGYERRSGELALITSSDAHDVASIGSRATWIKMTKPDLEGLRLALQDGNPLSVRNDRDGGNPNVHAGNVIESIRIEKGRYVGPGTPLELQLNPWLNAVIGGRGTGKSSIVELLRVALRREKEVPQALEAEWKAMMSVARERSARGILREETRIWVVYRKDGGRFRVGWDQAGTLPAIEEEVAPGQWQESVGSVSERFPVRIYSQKQVYELTRDPESLLRIVDEAPAVNARELVAGMVAEESKFLAYRAQARGMEQALADEPRVRGELEDVKRRLAVFESPGQADVLKNWQLRQRQQRSLDLWEKAAGSFGGELRIAAEAGPPPELDAGEFEAGEAASVELLASTSAVVTRLSALQGEALKLAHQMEAVVADWRAARSGLAWSAELQGANEAYDALLAALKAAGGGDPSEYGRLVQLRQTLETRLNQFSGQRAGRASLLTQANDALTRLRGLRDELTTRRARFLSQTLGGNEHVRIEVMPMGATGGYERDLRRLLGRDDGFAPDIGTPDEPGTLLGDLAGAYTTTFESGDAAKRAVVVAAFHARLNALKQRLHALRGGTAVPNHATFAKYMGGRPPEQMDRLDAWFPADTLLVSFKVKGAGNAFKPITQGSPGQRSAALLAFLLSYGNEPIILDQPEDDLDNRVITDTIIESLRAIKTKRQVLVVTHNANIVVNGDAEYVASLDTVRGQTVITPGSGGLQESAVRQKVCEIMEGGAEAFRERYRRMGGQHV